jgi:hypothetical protein
MSLALILADLKHQINRLLVLTGELQGPLVSDEAAIVGELSDGLQHGGSELVIVVESRLDHLGRLLEGDRAATIRDHLVKELQTVPRWEILQGEGLVGQIVQIILRQVRAREEVLVLVDLRLVINQLGHHGGANNGNNS